MNICFLNLSSSLIILFNVTSIKGIISATCEDKNAEYQECPSMCQPTCEQPEEKVPCPAVCAPAGCVCKLGFLLSDGKCVRPENCPGE